MFNRIKQVITLFSVAALCSVQVQAQTEIDKIVAVVDQDVVLFSELNNRVNTIKQRFKDTDTRLPPDSVLQDQVLDALILERLQLAVAQRIGVQIPEDQIQQTFAQIAAGNNLSPEQMIEQLVADGESINGLFRDLRKDLTIQQTQEAVANSRINISDAEVNNFLNSAEGQFWSAPNYNLQHILIPLNSSADPDEVINAQTLAASISEQLENGADFSTLAVQFSSGPAALEGGRLGWRRAIEFQPELAEAIEASEVGVPTQPIRAAGGIHIFLSLDVRGGNQEALIQQTKTRHILMSPNTIRSNEQTRDEIAQLRQQIIDGEDFVEVAKEHSEDISNALKGGDLGWVLPGVMVAPFEQAMNEAAVGVVSEPVQTQFGWHILLVEERRDVDMSDEILRNQARRVLRSQRFDEAVDLWQREIRSEAFVSIVEKQTDEATLDGLKLQLPR